MAFFSVLRMAVMLLGASVVGMYTAAAQSETQSTPAPALSAEDMQALLATMQRMMKGEPERDVVAVARLLAPAAQAELLAFAAGREMAGMVEALLDAGVPADARNAAGWTPLMVALVNRDESLALLLLKRGADPDATAPDGESVASLAAQMVPRELFRALALSRAVKSGHGMLAAAARMGDLSALSDALKAGAEVNQADGNGWTALHHAAAGGHGSLIPVLLEAGADASQAAPDGVTPLVVAVLAGDRETAGVLLSNGADPNVKAEGVPVLSVAIAGRSETIVEDLLAAGADPTVPDEEGVRPAQLAHALGMPDLSEKLGGIPAEQAETGSTALLEAVLNEDVETTKSLLEAGASPNVTYSDGVTPLHVAALTPSAELVEVLLQYGADPTALSPSGDTPLILAVQNLRTTKHPRVVNALVSPANAPANLEQLSIRDGQGRTPLLHAVLAGEENGVSPSVIKTLLIGPPGAAQQDDSSRMRNLIVNQADNDGRTPFMLAVLGNQPTIASALYGLVASTEGPGGVSAQDIARSRQLWAVLGSLPDDRILSITPGDGLNFDEKVHVQEKLSEWGYYTGEIDGMLGPHSVAALATFLKDRGNEILRICKSAALRFARCQPSTSEGWTGYTFTMSSKFWFVLSSQEDLVVMSGVYGTGYGGNGLFLDSRYSRQRIVTTKDHFEDVSWDVTAPGASQQNVTGSQASQNAAANQPPALGQGCRTALMDFRQDGNSPTWGRGCSIGGAMWRFWCNSGRMVDVDTSVDQDYYGKCH